MDEQSPPDVLTWRPDWFGDQLDLDPARLEFVDETGATAKMARRHGRAPRGQRLSTSVPHGTLDPKGSEANTTTFIGGLRRRGMTALTVLDGPKTDAWFQPYVEQELVPALDV